MRLQVRLLVTILGVQNAPFVDVKIVEASVFFGCIDLFTWGKGSSGRSLYKLGKITMISCSTKLLIQGESNMYLFIYSPLLLEPFSEVNSHVGFLLRYYV